MPAGSKELVHHISERLGEQGWDASARKWQEETGSRRPGGSHKKGDSELTESAYPKGERRATPDYRLDACIAAVDTVSRRLDALARTDPPVSEKQRRAMHAAAEGRGNIGIPKDVGEEFAAADPGGKLPEEKDDE